MRCGAVRPSGRPARTDTIALMRPIPRIGPVETAARPRWSVVVPVHNCAPFLADALTGVLAQLPAVDSEVIVLDDDSDDDPAQVVEQVGRGRVRLVANPGRLGASTTFNRGLELASGEFVHLLHGDDAVLPGFYQAMGSALDTTTALAAICRVEDIDAANVPLYRTRSYRRGTGVWSDALEALAVSNRVRAPGIVVRRSAYELVGGFRTDLPHAADWDMWTRLAAHGPVVFVDQVLARYRRHPGSDSRARVLSGANIRERVSAIGVLAGYLEPRRRPWLTRRALLYAAVFATRTSLSLARSREWRAAGVQLAEATRCLVRLPGGMATISR